MDGFGTVYIRRMRLLTRNPRGVLVPLAVPLLFALIVAPALDEALGGFNQSVDYMTYVALATAVLLVPLNSMFGGITVLIDRDYGITRELLAAPIPRWVIPAANAAAITTVALAQVAVLVLATWARGGEFGADPAGVTWFVLAIVLLAVGTYGMAETVAQLIGQTDEYIATVPAIAIAPWFFAGSLFPITVLPAGIEQLAMVLPWTHATGLVRSGLMDGTDPVLHDVWGMDSTGAMAALSLGVLAVFALGTMWLATVTFRRKTIA